MKSTAELRIKIGAAQREFHRYTGVSAEYERRGFGSSRVDLCWARRFPLSPDKAPTSPRAPNSVDPKPDPCFLRQYSFGS